MATTLFYKLAISAATTTLNLTLFNSLPATAAIVTYDFEFKYKSFVGYLLPLEFPITGSFSYDDSLIQNYSCPYYSTTDCYPQTKDFNAYVNLTDFKIKFLGTTFAKKNAQTFNLAWDIKQVFRYPIGPNIRTSLFGTATWNNPYLNLDFSTPFYPLGNSIDSEPLGNPINSENVAYGVYLSTSLPTSLTRFTTLTSEFTKRDTTITPIPEGTQELALLSLGLFGIATLFK